MFQSTRTRSRPRLSRLENLQRLAARCAASRTSNPSSRKVLPRIIRTALRIVHHQCFRHDVRLSCGPGDGPRRCRDPAGPSVSRSKREAARRPSAAAPPSGSAPAPPSACRWRPAWCSCAATATPPMFLAMSPTPLAASAMLRPISLVVTVCSSTARGDGVRDVVDLVDDRCRSPIAFTAPLVSLWIASIFWLMSSVALAVCLASSLTSLATTAKPLPASPARAASMVALRASRLVCCAIEVITLITLPISVLDSPSFVDGVVGRSAPRLTAFLATRADSLAFLAISRIEALHLLRRRRRPSRRSSRPARWPPRPRWPASRSPRRCRPSAG